MSHAERTLVPGIDLVKWWPDLRRLVLAKYAGWLQREGLELEDVLGETARRILVANEGEHPFDARLGEPQLYLLRQARSAIKNMLEQRQRWVRDGLSDHGDPDTFDLPSEQGTNDTTLDTTVDQVLAEGQLDPRDRGIVRLYLEGHSRSEIVAFTSSAPSRVAEVIRCVRHVARVGR